VGIIEFALGAALVGVVLNDVFSTVIVPRPTPSRFRPAALLTRFGWRGWRARFGAVTPPQQRERRMGTFAPLIVMALLTTWILMLIAGYGLMFDAVRDSLRPSPDSLGTSLYFAAVSLLTIGYGDYVATDGLARVVAIAAAATGLGVVALTITYLFSLYANLERREILVTTLDARAGSPPSGVRLLEHCAELGMRADLERVDGGEPLRPSAPASLPARPYWPSLRVDVTGGTRSGTSDHPIPVCSGDRRDRFRAVSAAALTCVPHDKWGPLCSCARGGRRPGHS